MVNVTKERYEANCTEVITDKLGELWLNERHLQQKLGHKNLPALRNKYNKKCTSELNELNHNDLALKIIMDCRTNESCNFFKKS